MLDDPVASTTELEHGTHVASIAAGVIGGTTHGVAPDANIVFLRLMMEQMIELLI